MSEPLSPRSPEYSDTRLQKRARAIIAAALTLIGAVLLTVSFTALPWGGGFSFSDYGQALRDGAGTVGAPPSDADGPASHLSLAYFPVLAWVLLLLVVAFGLLAATRPRPWLRVVGCLLAVAGTALTFLAWHDETPGTRPGVGVTTAMAGFLIVAIGTAYGPRPR